MVKKEDKMIINFEDKNKLAFSLLEVCVTMAIVAVFIAASTNVFTQKFKKRISLPAHGHYECYYDDAGNLKQQMYNGDNKVLDETVAAGSMCNFKPPKNAAYIILTAVGAGGHGGSKYGGSAGDYANSFISGTTHQMKMLPGLAANSLSETSGSTVVYDIGENGTEPTTNPIMTKVGGRNDSSSTLWLKDCRITYAEKYCKITPHCTLFNKDSYLEIEFCAKNDDLGTDPDSEAIVKIDYFNASPTAEGIPPLLTVLPDEQGGISYDYKDSSGNYMFTFVTEIDGNFTEFQEKTPLEGYIKSLKLELKTDGIGKLAIPPGTGGAKESKGGNGAVMITW